MNNREMKALNTGFRPLRAGLLLALVAATGSLPVEARGWWGRSTASAEQGGPGAVRIPAETDWTTRRAPAGRRNLIALMGGSADGSPEEMFTRNLHQRVGGEYLHGEYGVQDLVDRMVPRTGQRQPISNLYFTGHTVGTPVTNFPGMRPVRPGEPNVGFLLAGKQQMDHALNYNNQFFQRYDARMNELGLTPDQVWAPDAQIILKNCKAAYYDRPFLEEFARRVPKGATIEAYDRDYNWSSFTQYPFGIQTNLRHNLGRQQEGLVVLPGRWEPPSRTAQAPQLEAPAEAATTVPEAPAESAPESTSLGSRDRSSLD